jgi:hypothetical protein
MQAIPMTLEEKEAFKELKVKVETLEDRFDKIEAKINSILNIVKGIAIGIAIGAVIFGVISIKDFISVTK